MGPTKSKKKEKLSYDDMAAQAAIKDMGDKSFLEPPPEKKKSGGAMKYAKGGMPDLTGDGKVTRADVLKGRGVFKKGGNVPKGMHRMPDGSMMKDSEHKKPKQKMGGGMMKYAHGGKIDGCAVRGKTRGKTV